MRQTYYYEGFTGGLTIRCITEDGWRYEFWFRASDGQCETFAKAP